MERFFFNTLLFIVAVVLVCFLAAVFWHHIAFKYIFQAFVSIGFIISGFYYILRTRVSGNLQKGLLLILLSPISFYLSDLFFFIGVNSFHKPSGRWLPSPAIVQVLDNGRNTYFHFGAIRISLFNFFIVLFCMANAFVIAKNPRPRKFIAVNIVVLAGCILLYHVKKF